MEEFHAAACACGQPITKTFRSGKLGKYCNQCMDRQAGRTKGAWKRGDIPCAGCQTLFAPKAAHQKFCTDQCKYRERDRRESATGLPRAEYLTMIAAKAKAARSFTCARCGVIASRRLSGTNATAGYINKYCSLSCRIAARAVPAVGVRLRQGWHSNCFGSHCQLCSRPFVSRRAKEMCSAACDARARGRAVHVQLARSVRCKDCDLEFCPMYGRSQATLCQPCAVSRARAYRLVGKSTRRARQRAATVEFVDPIRVFERDGWACQLCSTPTPRAKRGTCDPDAPELDHVVALAAGGEHSYRNTQCACRRCNGLKSDKPIEEVAASMLAGRASQQRGRHATAAEVDMQKGGMWRPD